MAAIAESVRPQTIFTKLVGLIVPFELSIPSTNVAESADVMKKIATTTSVSIDIRVPSGYSASTPNVDVSSAKSDIIAKPCCSTFNAETPNIAIKITHTIAGTINTPSINSLIVRPLDILAIKIPTNGAHETHHAQ